MQRSTNYVRSGGGSFQATRGVIDFVNITVTSAGAEYGPDDKTHVSRSRNRYVGIEYTVPLSNLQGLLSTLYGRHGEFFQLKIMFEADVSTVSLRFSQTTLCDARVKCIKLYAHGDCTLSMAARFCSKPIWDWVELRPHQHGDGQCSLVHDFKIRHLLKPVLPEAPLEVPRSQHGVRSVPSSYAASSLAPASSASSRQHPAPSVAESQSSHATSDHRHSSRHDRDHTGRRRDVELSPHYLSSRDRRRTRHGEDVPRAHGSRHYRDTNHIPRDDRSTVPLQPTTLRNTVLMDAPPPPAEVAPFSGLAEDFQNAFQNLSIPDPGWGEPSPGSHSLSDRFERVENRGRADVLPAVPDAPVPADPVLYPPGYADNPAERQNFAAAATQRARAEDEWTESGGESLFEQFPFRGAASRRGGSVASRGGPSHDSPRSGFASLFSRGRTNNVSTAASSFSAANSGFSGPASAHLSSGPADPAAFSGLGRHVDKFDDSDVDGVDVMPTGPHLGMRAPPALMPFHR